MSTATPTEPAHGHTASAMAGEPQAIDPERDIDAKKTTIVLIISTVFVFGSVWLLSHVFAVVVQSQRVERVEQAPTEQIDTLRAWEIEQLKAGDGRKSIEDSIKELAK